MAEGRWGGAHGHYHKNAPQVRLEIKAEYLFVQNLSLLGEFFPSNFQGIHELKEKKGGGVVSTVLPVLPVGRFTVITNYDIIGGEFWNKNPL